MNYLYMLRDYIPDAPGALLMPPFPGNAAEVDAPAARTPGWTAAPWPPRAPQSAGAVNPFADTLEPRAAKEAPPP